MTDEAPRSPNKFERDKPGTDARTTAEGAIARLRSSSGIFVEAVAATRMPMAVTDPTLPGNPIVFANEAFLAVSGYAMDEVLGQQPHFMDGPETDPADAARFDEALRNGEDTVVEAVQYRKDGSKFHASIFLRPLTGEDGRTKNHFLSYFDITRRVEAEAEVRRQARELERRAETSEKAAAEADFRYRTLFESIEAGFCVVEVLFDAGERPVDYRFLEVNPAFEAQTGLVDAAGKRMRELRPEHEDFWFETYGRIARTGRAERFEHEAKALGFWYDVYAFPIGDAEQRHVAILFSDITARRRTEAALRESEERFRLIVENATDYAIVITDPDDIITDWLPGAEAVFGWRAEEAVGRPGGIVFTPEDQASGEPEKEIETARRQGYAPDVRWHQRKDGSLVFIEGTVTPLRNEHGSIRGYLKIGQDVSERRNAQEALEVSERRMRSLATGIPQLVFRSWGTGERIWGSPQWIAYTGLSFEESLGFGWLEAVHPDDRGATMAAWQGVEERGGYYIEHRIRDARTGGWCWHQTRAAPLRDDEGKVLEWLGSSTEVEEMRRLQRHQQTLLGELQHRVRNTLGVVRSIARRTAELSDSKDDLADHLQGRLAAFARVQAAVTRTAMGGVDLAVLIEDELLAHAARESETVTIDGPDVNLKPRPAESLSLAIHELATNAVKYGALSRAGGTLSVRWTVEQRDGTALLRLGWEEGGMDLPPEKPSRRGFGMELLERSLPYELDAVTRAEFRPTGFIFTMELPLATLGAE